MKKLIVLLSLLFTIASGASFTEDLNTANDLYKQKKQKEAKEYYIKASKNNSAQAHFKLAYQYVVDKETAIYHYSKAAKLGHSKALFYTLEELFFRANDLLLSNPKKALEVYNIAKNNNSEITFYDEKDSIRILKMAAEVPLFKAEEFIKQYQLEKDEDFKNDGYYIWKLAEKASRGEIFKNSNPELVLQLIIKGAFVPAEVKSAVSDYYDIWKNNKELVEFDICNYVTSTYGMSLCAKRQEEAENNKIEKELSLLLKDINLNNSDLLYSAYKNTSKYLDTKVWYEEGHDGSGYAQWATSSLLNQKNEYIKFIRKIANGFVPIVKASLSENDKILNKRYKKIKERLKKTPVRGMRMSIMEKDFIKVQRSWIDYRDINVELYTSISKQKDKKFWENYITSQRIKDYNLLEDTINIFN